MVFRPPSGGPYFLVWRSLHQHSNSRHVAEGGGVWIADVEGEDFGGGQPRIAFVFPAESDFGVFRYFYKVDEAVAPPCRFHSR